jgi:K(+)-stimulated pyrophosphate-energized sodium pump
MKGLFMSRAGACLKTLSWLAVMLAAYGLGALPAAAGEADVQIPDLSQATYALLGGVRGDHLLYFGFLICLLGVGFALLQAKNLKDMPVHRAMVEMSELIYATCREYLLKQGRFLLILEGLIGLCIIYYFGVLSHRSAFDVIVILVSSVVGILGSYGVAWFGIRINTFANSRTAFASLRGKPFPVFAIPLQAGMSIGLLLICTELLVMLTILLLVPGQLAGPCFIGFAIGESLGASVLRICGGIFTKIADIGADLMKVVFKIKEDDARNPGVIADCTGDNAGDSVGPTADGFETYGVTGVALIVFITLAVAPGLEEMARAPMVASMLVWIFAMRILMIVTSLGSYFVNGALARSRYGNVDKMDFEAPLTSLVWITSVVSIAVTYIVSYFMLGDMAEGLWWKLSTIISCGTLAAAVIPELTKVFTSSHSGHVAEVVDSTREGGTSLTILSGVVAGNYSAFWMGLALMGLMLIAYLTSTAIPANVISYTPVFAFGLVAFGMLGMGPVTIAVDSYGPVTDNAQSIYELSLIEEVPNIEAELQSQYGFTPRFDRAKHYLEDNDGAGNTFKATAKPVLIGTAVAGATTMIFSIILVLQRHFREEAMARVSQMMAQVQDFANQAGLDQAVLEQLKQQITQASEGLANFISLERLSMIDPNILLGFITGGAVIYWFCGASMQAVTTGAYRAVEFIKRNIRLEGTTKASVEDSTRVVGICTQYAQAGMWNIFLTVFFLTLSFAFYNPFFFVAYLISIALFGLFQAIFMANAGGCWDNAKKVVEVELKEKGTELHAATVVGDTVGDPYKDTSSVALNPIIKFTTLFGLLAVEISLEMATGLKAALSIVFLLVGLFFVWRSFYGMRIQSARTQATATREAAA